MLARGEDGSAASVHGRERLCNPLPQGSAYRTGAPEPPAEWSLSGAVVSQHADEPRLRRVAAVRRMIDPVIDGHLVEIEGADPRQAGNVDAVLSRVRSSLMVCVDAASGAEVVLRGPRIETVDGELIPAGEHGQVADDGG